MSHPGPAGEVEAGPEGPGVGAFFDLDGTPAAYLAALNEWPAAG